MMLVVETLHVGCPQYTNYISVMLCSMTTPGVEYISLSSLDDRWSQIFQFSQEICACGEIN